MSVTIPSGLVSIVDLLAGQSWPPGDEDAVRIVAQIWATAMTDVLNLTGNANNSAIKVHANVNSTSAEAFGEFWDSYINSHGSGGQLVALGRQFEVMAESLLSFANELEYTKLQIIAAAALTALQLIWAVSMAWLTDGVSLADIPYLVAAGRRAAAISIGRFIQMAAMMVIPDLFAQGVLDAQHRAAWDWRKTWNATENGFVTGIVAMFFSSAFGKLPWMAEGAAAKFDQRILQALTHFVEGGVVADVSQRALGEITHKPSNANLLSLLQGGLLALIFHMASLINGDNIQVEFTGTNGDRYHIPIKHKTFDLLLENGTLPPKFSKGRVFNEKGWKVGNATPETPTIGTEITARYADASIRFVAQPDSSGQGVRFAPEASTQPAWQPQGVIIAYKDATFGHFPPNSEISIAGGLDSTDVYQVKAPLSPNRMGLFQTRDPGSPLEITGVERRNPLTGRKEYFAVNKTELPNPEDPHYATQLKSIATAKSLDSHPALTKVSPGDPAYEQAFGDWWKPGQAASQSSASAPAGQAAASRPARPRTQSSFPYPWTALSDATSARLRAETLHTDQAGKETSAVAAANRLATESGRLSEAADKLPSTEGFYRQQAAGYEKSIAAAAAREGRANEAQATLARSGDLRGAAQAERAAATAKREKEAFQTLRDQAAKLAQTAATERGRAARDARDLLDQAQVLRTQADGYRQAADAAAADAARYQRTADTAERQINANVTALQHEDLATEAGAKAQAAAGERDTMINLAEAKTREASQAGDETTRRAAEDAAKQAWRAAAERAAEVRAAQAEQRRHAALADAGFRLAEDPANPLRVAVETADAQAHGARELATQALAAEQAAGRHADEVSAALERARTAASRQEAMTARADATIAAGRQARSEREAGYLTAEAVSAYHTALTVAHNADDGTGGLPHLESIDVSNPAGRWASSTSPAVDIRPNLYDGEEKTLASFGGSMAFFRSVHRGDTSGEAEVSFLEKMFPWVPKRHIRQTRGIMNDMLKSIREDSSSSAVESAVADASAKIRETSSFSRLDPKLQHQALQRIHEIARRSVLEHKRASALEGAISDQRLLDQRLTTSDLPVEHWMRNTSRITSYTFYTVHKYSLKIITGPDGKKALAFEFQKTEKGGRLAPGPLFRSTWDVTFGIPGLPFTDNGMFGFGGWNYNAGQATAISQPIDERSTLALDLKWGWLPRLRFDYSARYVDSPTDARFHSVANPFIGPWLSTDLTRLSRYFDPVANLIVPGLHLSGTPLGPLLAFLHGINMASVGAHADPMIERDPETGHVTGMSSTIGLYWWLSSPGARVWLLQHLPLIGKIPVIGNLLNSNWGWAGLLEYPDIFALVKDSNGQLPVWMLRTAEVITRATTPSWFGNRLIGYTGLLQSGWDTKLAERVRNVQAPPAHPGPAHPGPAHPGP